MTIYKYIIEIEDAQNVKMPAGAKILSVQVQRDAVCLWAIVDPDAVIEKREIRIYGTGHFCPEDRADFIGTVQASGGNLIWHVFADKE